MILELDSTRQARRFLQFGVTAAVAQLTGMIRAALLISDRILVTDAMILDGLYFAHMPPEALAQALGMALHELPISVVCPRTPVVEGEALGRGEPGRIMSLGESLADKRSRATFLWQLEDHLKPSEIEAHWSDWTRSYLPLELEAYRSMEAFSPPDPRWFESLSPAATEFLDSVGELVIRSVVERHLVEARESAPGDNGIVQVHDWWETSYLFAIARALDSDWLRFDTPDQGRDGFRRGPTPGRHWVHVSHELLAAASSMTAAAYSVVRHVTRTDRAALAAKPSKPRMDDLMYAIAGALGGASRVRDLWGAVARLVIALVAVAFSLPFEARWLPSGVLVWVGIAVVAVSTVPWDAVATMFRSTTRQDAVMSFRSEPGS